MSHVVGPKGQIVVSKDIRQRLGIKPGWQALQRLVGDHVEVYFVPPEHTNSLKGSLADYCAVRVPQGEEWGEAKDKAWHVAARVKTGGRKDVR